MHTTIQRETLLRPLQLVAGMVDKRHTKPILANVLIRAATHGLTLTGTDLELEMVAFIPHDTADTVAVGAITVGARKLLDICRSLPEGAQMELRAEGEKLLVRSGRSRFNLSTLPAEEFPTVEGFRAVYTFSLARKALRTLVERTQFAMAQQDIRHYLNGLLLELTPEGIKTVATDGHRLALYDQPLPMAVSETLQVILPRKGVGELLRLLDDSSLAVEVRLGTNHICFNTGDLSLTSKLIDGRFPDYQRVLPKQSSKEVLVEREVFKGALQRVAILCNEKYRSVRMLVAPEKLVLQANNPEQEEVEEEVEAHYQGENVEIAFNVSYMQDAVGALTSSQVRLSLTDSASCCLVRSAENDHSKYIVMPMRL